jgi:hypothetical protein
MVQPIFMKMMLQPALHKVTTNRSKCAASPGMMWAVRAGRGSVGRLSKHVWVDDTRLPLGRRATRGMMAGMMLVTGAAVVRKWLIAPELRIAHSLMVLALVLIVFKNIEAAKA